MKLICRALLVCLAFGCSPTPRRSSPAVAAALDSFVPGVRIGSRAAPAAKRLHLTFWPYAGYADTTFHETHGVRGLVLRINESLDSEGQRPSWWARISEVGIAFVTRDGADSARQLLTRQLGVPRAFCYVAGDEQSRISLYFWPDRMPRGVLLTMPLQSAGRPFLTFGAIEPDSNRSAPAQCDAA